MKKWKQDIKEKEEEKEEDHYFFNKYWWTRNTGYNTDWMSVDETGLSDSDNT